MPQNLTNTTNWFPSFSDVVIEAYGRIQIRPSAITADHMQQAAQSARFMQSEWAVRTPSGPNLWKMQLNSIPLVQGVSTYAVPSNVVNITDYYIRQFQLGTAVNLTSGAFSTTASSATVTVFQVDHGLIPGEWVLFPIQVSIGGIVVYGQYQVITVVDANDYTITAATAASSTVTGGGSVPLFTTTQGSSVVTVALNNHGLYANQNFSVFVLTQVGGLSLAGNYVIASVVDANNFTITAPFPAASAAAVSENAGLPQVQPQLQNSSPIDFVIYPISRTEYADQPDKFSEARPTTVWFNRQINPVLTLWQTPDGNGPYTLYYWAETIQYDLALGAGTSPDVPQRFLEAYVSGLAAKLAIKYPPPPPNTLEKLDQMSERAWTWASQQDVEEVPLFISPGLSSYFR